MKKLTRFTVYIYLQKYITYIYHNPFEIKHKNIKSRIYLLKKKKLRQKKGK